jgi:hypothetical protein
LLRKATVAVAAVVEQVEVPDLAVADWVFLAAVAAAQVEEPAAGAD